MKVIYHCYGGSHSSVTAAAIHLGLLSKDKKPNSEDLMKLPFFDKQTDDQHGYIHLMGKDEFGNEIYICGCRSLGNNMEVLLNDITEKMGIINKGVKFINTLNGVNSYMRIGGFISRKLGLVSVGRPIVIKGTIEAFEKFVAMVENVKNSIH